MFGRTEYLALKKQLSFHRNYMVTVAIIILDWMLFAAGVFLLSKPGVGFFLLSQCIFAIVFFHNFCLLHECGHGNASSHSWLNTVTGMYASILCFMPFYPWKHIHQKHHVWAGNPVEDPTGRNLKRWQMEKRVPWLLRVAWRTWLPLGAFAQHCVFWAYPAVLLREDKSKLKQCAASVALLPLAYFALHLLNPGLFRVGNFVVGFVFYLFAEELVNLPHHSDLFKFSGRLPLWEQWKAARSCYYPFMLSELLVLNFNFHIEHHLYPSLPWYRLRRVRELLKPQLGAQYNESVGIGWNLANRTHDIEAIYLPK